MSPVKKVKFFFKVFKRSLFEPAYYNEVIKAKFSFSLKYLVFLLFLISLVWGISLGIRASLLLPKVGQFQTDAKAFLENFYPSELTVSIQGGKLTTNVEEPYYVDFPDIDLGVKESSLEHLIAIDTKAQATDIEKYKSAVLLTSDAAVVRDDGGGYRLFPLSGMKQDLVLNKLIWGNIVDTLTPYFKYIPTALYLSIVLSILLIPFVFTAFSLFGRLFYLLFASLLLLLVARVMKKKLSYPQVYRISMHAITLPVLLGFIFTFAGYPISGPLLFGILLVYEVLVFSRLKLAGS